MLTANDVVRLLRRACVCVLLVMAGLALNVASGSLPRAAAAQHFVVTNASGSANQRGSLPWALTAANNNRNGLDYISFAIPGAGTHYIQLSSTLFVTEPVVIDGATQRSGGGPGVYLLGGPSVSSLVLVAGTAGGSTIRGLGFIWFVNNAISIFEGADGTTVEGNWIGFAPSGSGVFLNWAYYPYGGGIGIQSSSNAIRNNVISGVYNGIVVGQAVEQPWNGRVYSGNSFSGNNIGTDPSGSTSAQYGNVSDGLFFGSGVQYSWIGPGNVFSGNGSAGVKIFHSSNVGNTVFQNHVGASRDGTRAIGNGELGIMFAWGASGNGAFNNLIVGNRYGGISVGGGGVGNFVEGNVIGMDLTQTRALGAQEVGVSLNTGATGTVVRGNVIGGHSQHGVILGNASGNGIYTNWIGQGGGYAPVSNGAWGIVFLSSSYNWAIGNAFGANGYGAVGQAESIGNAIA